ncbi:MAG: formate C-acetyltransferase [Clostridia bacterium]|nr:formate C-acetyltransferase [Clostridia bacterium]
MKYEFNAWTSFIGDTWKNEINVRDFIVNNYTYYDKDDTFLSEPTQKTEKLFSKIQSLMSQERDNNGIYKIDQNIVSSITSHGPGYIDKDLEVIFGLQTDEPLKRAIMPFGGIRMVEKAFEEYGYKLDAEIIKIFDEYRKTHNQGVFDVYTSAMKKARKSAIITGLPDAYGRGRIIGDYRRVALYGIDILVDDKKKQLLDLEKLVMLDENIRLREEITDQIKALENLVKMASSYGFDISKPATNAKEAVQWTYFAYLGAIKEQNGAAMSIGRISNFLDIYIERDLQNGVITESEAQEYIDQLVIKLRIVRFLRTKEYNALFSGDPNWITESIGGINVYGKPLITKTSYRMLHTLVNLGPAPEPNLTVLWSERLPEPFKKFCAKISITTSSIQYENDDLMNKYYGDDYAIACCVSPMKIGKQMQFFGARCNIAKLLLYAINAGKDEISFEQIGPNISLNNGEYLQYDEVMKCYQKMMQWCTKLYIDTLNVIHYMHDKYSYESLQMALHDKDVHRTMACGIAGLSVAVDSLSAIKYAKVKPIKNDFGIITDFEVDGDYPKFGNDDDRVDEIARQIQKMFMENLKKHKTYRNAETTMSILTITSNVVYGEKTGSTPDGRYKGEPFAPGANPMYNREKNGIGATLCSLSKLRYEDSMDGISYTFSAVPSTLGNDLNARVDNLVLLLDSYFAKQSQHININVLNKDVLIDAMENPDKYPNLTIRVSGYAVNFIKLSRKHQEDILSRTFF